MGFCAAKIKRRWRATLRPAATVPSLPAVSLPCAGYVGQMVVAVPPVHLDQIVEALHSSLWVHVGALEIAGPEGPKEDSPTRVKRFDEVE